MSNQTNPLTHRPLVNLEDEMEQRAKYSKTYDVVPVVYLAKLKQKIDSPYKIGDLVGKSQTAINGYLTNGEAPKTVELAAQLIYERDFCEEKIKQKSQKQVAALIKGESAHIKTAVDMIVSLGGSHAYIGDF